MKSKKKKSKSDNSGELVFIGSLMINIGLGIFYENTDVGTLVGFGQVLFFLDQLKLL